MTNLDLSSHLMMDQLRIALKNNLHSLNMLHVLSCCNMSEMQRKDIPLLFISEKC